MPHMKRQGSLVRLKNKVTAADTAIGDDYTPLFSGEVIMSTLMVSVSAGCKVSISVDGVYSVLNNDTALTANAWYLFNIPVYGGVPYNIKFSDIATAQIYWYWSDGE